MNELNYKMVDDELYIHAESVIEMMSNIKNDKNLTDDRMLRAMMGVWMNNIYRKRVEFRVV